MLHLKLGKERDFQSEALGEACQYWVHLHPAITTIGAANEVAVLFILDGNIHFDSMTGMIELVSSGVKGKHVIPKRSMLPFSIRIDARP